MKGRWIWVLMTANLVGLVGIAFVYPVPMVSPGPVGAAHAAVASECSACHAPFRGASAERCGKCHAAGDIGVRTTAGVSLGDRGGRPAFHQALTEQDCVACHTDHVAATTLGPRSRKPFAHELVRAAVRDRCQTCHAAPASDLHRDLGAMACGQCHTTAHWKPATFEHATLAKTVLERCETCHQTPTSGEHPQVSGPCQQCHTTEHWKPAHFEHGQLAKATLDRCEGCHKLPATGPHPAVNGQCQQCHTTERWKPASFEHAKFFELDRNHAVACVTCHTENDYKRYTCYGCHEHTPDKIRAEHEEEGIRNPDNCVSCHKSPRGEHGGRGEHGEGRGKEH